MGKWKKRGELSQELKSLLFYLSVGERAQIDRSVGFLGSTDHHSQCWQNNLAKVLQTTSTDHATTSLWLQASQTPRLPDEYSQTSWLPGWGYLSVGISNSKKCQSLMFKIEYEIMLIHFKSRKTISKHENESKCIADYWFTYEMLQHIGTKQWGRKEFLDK